VPQRGLEHFVITLLALLVSLQFPALMRRLRFQFLVTLLNLSYLGLNFFILGGCQGLACLCAHLKLIYSISIVFLGNSLLI